MRALAITPLLVVSTLLLAGCASGRINSKWPFPTEAAAAARHDSQNDQPIRQLQVNLARLIESRMLQEDIKFEINDEPDRIHKTKHRETERTPFFQSLLGGRPRTSSPPPLAGPKTIKINGNAEDRLDQMIAAVRQAGPNNAKVRNDVVAAWMAASTANCNVYVQALRSGQVSARLSSDFFSGGLALASSLAAPPQSARVLAGLSAFATAEGASIDRNIFAQQGAEIIADSILVLRGKRRTQLESRMAQSYDQWPMALAMVDLFEFHGDCSMLRGFSALREAVNSREREVQAIRQAAAALERSGATPSQMTAVIASLQSGRDETLQPHLPGLGPVGQIAWEGDLGAPRTAALDCLNGVFQVLLATAEKNMDAVLAEEPFTQCAAKTGLELRFVTVAKEALEGVKEKVNTAQTQGVAATTGADALEDEAEQINAREAATTQRKGQLNDLHRVAAATYAEKATILAGSIGNVRKDAFTVIANWHPNRAPEEVVSALKIVGGANIEAQDRVFALAIAAAEKSKETHTSGDAGIAAARQAYAAARAAVGD